MTEVKKRNISGSLTKKNIEISQLEIFPDALLQHGIPLLIKKGSVKNVTIKMPTKFKTDPITLNIESVTILCSVCTHDPIPEEIKNMKFHKLKAYQLFRKKYKMILGLLHKESVFSVVRTILSNLNMEINHIHIQIEYESKSKFDLTIPSFKYPQDYSKSSKYKPSQNSDDYAEYEEQESSINLSENSSNESANEEESLDEDSSDLNEEAIKMQRFSSYKKLIDNDQKEKENEKITSIGITISKMSLFNIGNSKETSNKKFTKDVKFSNFGMYMDVDESPVDLSTTENCEAELYNLFNSKKHNWILKQFSFNSTLKFEKDNPQIFFEPVIKQICINLKEEFIPIILNILKSVDVFLKKFAKALIPKPSFNDPNSLWIYCHKCAVSKISNPTFDFSKSLSLLEKRIIYIKNYKRKNIKSQNIIKNLEETLDYSNIVAFRCAYRLIHRKKRKSKKRSKITEKTTHKIIKEIRVDPVHSVTKLLEMFSLNFIGSLLNIVLTRNEQKHIEINIKNPHLLIEKDLKSVLIHIDISYLCAKLKDNVIINTIDNDQIKMKAEIIIPFHCYSNWLVSLDMSNNNYSLNMKYLLQVITDIKFIKLFLLEKNNLLMQSFRKKNFQFNIQIFSSVLKILGSKHYHAIQISFDKFLLLTDPKTFEKKFKFEKSILSFITENEAKISTDFSFTGSSIGKDLNLDIPFFSCVIPFKYYIVIEDFILLFMKHQVFFKDPAFPKIDINFVINMKGMDINITNLNSDQNITVQARQIMLSLKDSIFYYSLLSIIIQDLFQLSNSTFYYDKNSSNLKVSSIYIKVIELIELIPQNVFNLINNQNKILFDEDYNIIDNVSDSKNHDVIKKDDNFQFPNLKIEIDIDNIEVDFSITNTEHINLNLKNVKALFNNDKLKASALVDRIQFEDQLILFEPISCQLNVIVGKISKITIFLDKCNIIMNNMLINNFSHLDFSTNKLKLSNEAQFKLIINLNQIIISNDLIIQKFHFEFFQNYSIINSLIKFESVKSSFLNSDSNCCIQIDGDIEQKTVDLNSDLTELTIYTIPFLEIFSRLPTIEIPIPQIKFNFIMKPLQCNLLIDDDYLNVIFNSQTKLKLDNLTKQIPSIILKTTDFLINLNNNELLNIQYFKFTMDKNITINVPSIIIKLTIFKIYKILKLLPIDHQIPITNLDMKPKILIKGISYESMIVQIPLIEIDIHKTNSKKCISFKFDNTELYLKYSNQKYILYASTNVLFDAFNGFLSYHLAEPFGIVSNGEFSETTKACTFEAQNPIKFEISSYVINQIIKNLSIKEDEMEQSYSISNETGTKIIITIDNDTYEIESQAKIQNVPNFVGSDIIIKIGEISNPTKIYSSFSKIAYPFFFGNSFILLWMDVKRLQLRLLSPIIFKNTSNLDLKIEFLNREITLKNNEIHYLDYTINKLDSITVKLGEDQQKIQLNELSIIKLDNKFIVVTKKRKIETLQIKIKFKAPFCFRNELISDLTILLKDKQIVLKPCEIVPFPYFSPSSEIISFDILDTKDIKGLHIDLLLNEIKEFIPTSDQNGNQFILQFTLSRKKWNNTISISPLLIFYSSLSIPLIFSLSKDEQIKKEKISENISKVFPYQKSQNVWMINNPTMISPFIVDIKNINIYISTKYSNQWSPNPLTMSDFDIIEDLMIPINDEIISFCHFHILSHNNIRPNTLIFFISPKYFINNQTEYTFSLNFIDGESIEISPNSIIPVTIIRNTLKFSMSVIDVNSNKKKNLVYSHKISIDKINSQFIKLKSIESPILLQLSTKKEIHFITILFNQTLPYLFVNNTQSKVIFVQKDTPDFAHVVMPNESLPFFIFDENMPTIIFCEIGNKIYFELDVNEPSFPVKIEIPENSNIQMNLYYYVDLSRKEGSTITLCNIIDNEIYTNNNFSPNSSVNYRIFMGLANNREESSTNLNKTKPSQINNNVLNLSFNFNYISFLIITSQYQEMCRLTLKDVLIDSSIHDFSTRTQFSIGLIKIDDQNQYAIYPTVFQIFPVSNQPALKFFYTSFGSHKYGKIGIDIRPISVRIDLSFLSDFIGDIFYFHNHYKNKKLYDVQITEIIHNLMPKQTKYHINKISINPFKVHLSFNKISTRSNHPFQQEFQFNRLINFIPSFEHIAITIEESHFFRNLSGTPDEIFFNISHEIKKLILKRLYRKISTLGTRELMMMKNESKQELILNKTVSILTFAESTFTYISSIMDLYTGSPLSFRTDETSIGALSWGFSSLYSSVKNGFKQLISETKKRGKINGKNDYCGYLVGAGIGVSKCAAYCLSGFCNLNASLFSSVKRIFLTEKFIFLNERECEPSLGLHCSDNEKLLWYTGSVSSGLIEVYSKSIFILDENLFIQNIVRAEIKESRVIIFDEDENEFNTTFENEKQANYFFSIVESHLLRKKIIELTDDKSLDDDD